MSGALGARWARHAQEGRVCVRARAHCVCMYVSARADLQSHCDFLTCRRSHSGGPSRIWEGGGELSLLYFFHGKLKCMTGSGGID